MLHGSYSVTNAVLEIRIDNESTIASAPRPPVIGYAACPSQGNGDLVVTNDSPRISVSQKKPRRDRAKYA